MLKDHIWPLSAYFHYELLQCKNEGIDMESMEERLNAYHNLRDGDPEKETEAGWLMDAFQNLPIRKDYPYDEPSGYEEIVQKRPRNLRIPEFDINSIDHDILYDKIYGAWLGRCAGCLLGQPVEFWHRERLLGLLKDTGNYPVKYYISSDIHESIRQKYDVRDTAWIYGSSVASWINNISYMPEDDDINYVILALKMLELGGKGFTSDSVAGRWLEDLPILHTFTAERIAYANVVNRIFPPQSASFRNPCREWIGAQIRGDFYGYMNPGNPERAAEMAWRDAVVSHTKNGIYGEMFVSAVLASTVFTQTAEELISYGLSQIPDDSRFSEAILELIELKDQGYTWEQMITHIHSLYNEKEEYDSLYVLPNAMVVCTGLLYGELDLEKSLGITLSGSFDKDCNCATVGSIVGMVLGASALPKKWIAPLNDKVKSGVYGFGMENISDLARRTVKIAGATP